MSSLTMPTHQPICPLDGQKRPSYAYDVEEICLQRLEQAREAFTRWRRVPPKERVACVERLQRLLAEREEEWSQLMTYEMGKLPEEGLPEIRKCALLCQWYASHAVELLRDQPQAADQGERFLSYQPLGPILAIMPWNFPFWQTFRAAVPTLLAGNTVILKHAPNVPGCSDALTEAFNACFPQHVFQEIKATNETVSTLLADPRLKGVCLTGSDGAGRQIGEQAGRHLKPVVLELGGSDPYLIMPDADLDLALEYCIRGRMRNNGQSCIAAKRMIVHADLHDAFVAALAKHAATYRWGDPRQEGINQGPMARHDLRDSLHHQVMRTVEAGATLVCGGEVPDHPGAFYPVTILTGVQPGMAAFDEELFGPVFAIVRAESEQEMIDLANHTRYGLGAAIFSRNIARARQIARDELNAGCCSVNASVSSDPRVPFGGINDSGLGRELGAAGLYSFCNWKTILVHGR
ncbi:MAG: NAD-dependent succinate-semialdehyde dehydrogenase [Verrucomicrobiota bacterium JB022]|nr:NAD-dependent succinate-semialdehyde dehydrogenase [Verrucomicrobiota bacterium JB022]